MKTLDRDRRRDDKRERILAAARAEVLAHGVDRLSLRAVARRARYSAAGLYEHFDSKAHLVLELASRAEGALSVATARAAGRGRTPAERLVQMGLAYVRFAQRSPEDFLLLFGRASARRSLAHDVPPGSPYGLLRAAVAAVLELDGSRATLIEAFAYGFWSTVHGMAMLRLGHLAGFRADLDTASRLVLESIVEGWSRAATVRSKGR